MRISLGEQHQVSMLMIQAEDSIRRAQGQENACKVAVQRWQAKLVDLQRHVAAVHSMANESLLSDLVERYMAEIEEKNEEIAEIVK